MPNGVRILPAALDVEWYIKTIILQGRRITDLHQKIQELREAFEYHVEYHPGEGTRDSV